MFIIVMVLAGGFPQDHNSVVVHGDADSVPCRFCFTLEFHHREFGWTMDKRRNISLEGVGARWFLREKFLSDFNRKKIVSDDTGKIVYCL